MNESSKPLNIVKNEEQEARDPYLCAWAEFHFLATLAHIDEHPDKKPEIIVGQTISDDGSIYTTYCIEKGFLEGVEFADESDIRGVKTGPRTLLGIHGDSVDVILIPESYTLNTGRTIRDNFLKQVGEMATNSPTLINDEYIQAKYRIIKRALERHRTSNPAELYEILKRKLLLIYELNPKDR